MSSATQPDLRYPVGPWQPPTDVTNEARKEAVATLAAMPTRLKAAVAGLNAEQLDTPYRPGGWTLRQVVHHLADSHMNAYIRWKFALTEPNPLIKAYDEAEWAKLPDNALPIDASLRIVEGVHQRLVALMYEMTAEQWRRTFNHPERGVVRLDMAAMMYSWHSRHHVAHITELRKRMGW